MPRPKAIVPAPIAPEPTAAAVVALKLEVVQPISVIEILSDRVVYTNPTIELNEYLLLSKPTFQQINRLKPSRAVVAHGLIIIEELGLSLPVQAARIRTG